MSGTARGGPDPIVDLVSAAPNAQSMGMKRIGLMGVVAALLSRPVVEGELC
jgi:hypothetical protein